MQENDFEKQVHQKMGELKMLPSETVWEQVEMRLHKKDRRRGWLLWLPLLLAGLLLPAYFIFFNGDSAPAKKHQGAVVAPALPTVTAANSNRDETVEKVQSSTPGTAIPSNSQPVPESLASKRMISTGPGDSAGHVPSHSQATPSQIRNQQHAVSATTASASIAQAASKRRGKHSFVEKTSQTFSTAASREAADPAPTGSNKINLDVKAWTTTTLLTDQPLPPAIIGDLPKALQAIHVLPLSSSQAMPIIDPVTIHHKRWHWGITASGGRSSLTKAGMGNLLNAGSGAFNSAAPGNLNNGAIGNTVYVEIYPVRPSAGFSAGLFARKEISSRFSISAGIGYARLTTTNTTGKKVDSVIQVNASFSADRQYAASYFRSGNTGSFTNRYHYLQVPVILQTNLTRRWRLPVYWDLGLSVSRLIASNALHFDNTTGVYYENNSMINKTQFNMVTGFPVQLVSGRAFGLQAGPELQYALSKAGSVSYGSSYHFLFVGLKAAMVLGKK